MKCGAKEEARMREAVYLDGKYVDRLCYSLLKDEWEGDKDE